MILFPACLNKPDPLFKVSQSAFIDDLSHSDLVSLKYDNLFDLSQWYNLTPSTLLDKHTPKKTKTITEHTKAEWHISELGEQKCALWKLERKSNQSKLANNASI